ncbi:PEP/pyruvate-binding domain-containing protein [Pengzhenrongella phosphoraccumulans]|uniref:PEP/pyruvate-binding domain-containing protein n=1 Tax=Pengzhenrongella phosphoraccumulans TaxID=3114394 RepID=UPI00388E2407
MAFFIDLGSPVAGLGGKGRSLAELVAAGFDVPPGFAVTATALRRVVEHNGRREAVLAALGRLDKASLPDVVVDLATALAGLEWPAELLADLADQIRVLDGKPGGRFAIRSSALAEDGAALSFAGQYRTLLEVEPADVADAVLDCYRSLFDEHVLHYHLDHGVPVDPDAMTVLVQQLVDAEVSGVTFTVNPVTGHDTELVIEAVRGLGEDLVAGRVRPVRYVRDWFGRTTGTIAPSADHPADGPLSAGHLDAVADVCVRVQRHYGFPVDVEWAIADGEVRLLQARPITRLGYAGIRDQWTTANFKDSGVSSTVCTPFMWSLYEYIWEDWLPKYLLDSALLRPGELRRLGDLFFGRVYWNLSVVKHAMAVAPGYPERAFDAELGVKITYGGDGTVTALTPRTLARVARAALRQRAIVAERRATVTSLRGELLATYAARLDELADASGAVEITRLWRQIVVTDYHRSEGIYFWQVFINQVHLALARDAIVAVVGHEGYLDLIGGLDDVSHLRPFDGALALARRVRAEPGELAWWRSTRPDEIVAALDAGSTENRLGEVRDLIERFGYHSLREIDVTHPDFDTDHRPVVAMVLDALGLDPDDDPHADGRRRTRRRVETLARARDRLVRRVAGREVGRRRYAAFARRVTRTRELLWWREEFRDCSTRQYHLIRLASLRLGEVLVAESVLGLADDVWFAKAFDLVAFLDGSMSGAELRRQVARNRAYYDSFRNWEPENEIGHAFDGAGEELVGTPGAVSGIGSSTGSVTGTARVIAGLDDIGRLNPGEILVTTFTDTGWTSKFALIAGLVTEYGGILCHAATISREYGIPCVVAATGCTTRIPDGATIHVDGPSGQVRILSEAR